MSASITGPVVHLATQIIDSLGLAGVAVMTATTGVIGLPGSEPTMLFAGFGVYNHHFTMLGIIVFGVLGDLVGATIAYTIGYWGEKELIERHGAKFHLSSVRVDKATRWFERYGSVAVFISRLIPGARFAFPYAAGVAKMPYPRFILFAALGSIVWITGLGFLGRAVGSNWQSWRNHLEYVDYFFIAVVVIGVVYLIMRRVRRDPSAAVDAVSD
ncbi:MAG TPA: DedA family protein [Solirubrobacteraceae bacterium]|nr:DedA family protein [Solirubrobacteraceae bacterium]